VAAGRGDDNPDGARRFPGSGAVSALHRTAAEEKTDVE
jgi:hypothetical protein